MDLSSRWDHCAALCLLLLAIGAMAGCQGISNSGSSSQSGSVSAANASLDFGTVVVGSSKTISDTITNSSLGSVTIASAKASNAQYEITGLAFPLMLAPGRSTSLSITFKPSTEGKPSGTVAIMMSSSSNPELDLAVSGSAVAAGTLTANPASLPFGSIPVGQSQAQSASLTNSGGSSLTISEASSTNGAFTVSGLILPLTLAPGQNTTFKVSFAPRATGAVNAAVSFNGAAWLTAGNVSNQQSSPTSVVVKVSGDGTAAGHLAVSPASLSFGSVVVGKSQSQSGKLMNSGSTSITISKASTSGAGFSVSGIALPLTLSPGQNEAFTATFAPMASGNVAGNIAFSAGVTTLNVALTGLGLPASSLGASPAIVNFGDVQVGNNQRQNITLTNWSSSSVTISQVSASGMGFRVTGLSPPVTLAAGQSTSFIATFTPSSAGSVAGNLAIRSNASDNLLTIALSGTGATVGALTSNPASIGFGSVQLGRSLTRSETLTNSGGSSINICGATVEGVGFGTSGLNLPTTLNAGQSLTFDVTFTPQTPGSASGTIIMAASGSVPSLNVSLSGTATAQGQLAVAPTTLSFGNVTVGNTVNQTGTLTASGASVTVSAMASSNPEFTVTGLSLPLTLASGQSASFSLAFTPKASGASSAMITFTSNAMNASVAESGSGNGAPATQHPVSLTWNASPSTIVGYHVYRGTQSGGPYLVLNGVTDASTSYVDNSVQSGRTYYYVVTAVSDSGSESAYSNQVQAMIPTP